MDIGWGARVTSAMVVLATTTAVGVGVFAYYTLESAAVPVELQRLQNQASELADDLEAYADGVATDLLATLNSGAVRGFVRAARAGGADPVTGIELPQWRAQINEDFVLALDARPQFDQLRLIAADGRELVRVDRTGADSTPRVTPADQLQAKTTRDYVAATLALDPGQLYASAIDLNREFGQVDPRRVPVLRLATPVADSSGATFGLLIVNVDMRPAFAALQAAALAQTDVYLTAADGAFLVHPDAAVTFDPDRAAEVQSRQPWLQPAAAEVPAAQATTRLVSMPDGARHGVASVRLQLANGPALTLAASVPYETLIGPVAALRQATLLATLAAIALAVAIAVLVARSLLRPLAQITRAVVSETTPETHVPAPLDAPGELGLLARAFEDMRADVQAKTTALASEVEIRREAQQRLALVIEACPSGMLIVDPAGRIGLANAQAYAIFGWPAESLVGEHVDQLVPERFRHAHEGLRQGYLEEPSARLMGQGRDLYGLRRDGEEFPVEIALNPIAADNRNLVLIVVADITERKASQELLEQQKQDLVRSNAELEQFAYVASHDLQEPLRMVASYTELLGERYGSQLDERADKYIHYAVDGARRMQRLVNDLLQFSRLGTQGKELAITDTNAILDKALASLQDTVTAAGAKVCHPDLPDVLADDVQLERVFQNLIGNALKFRSEAPPQVVIDCQRQDDQWQFSVADNGIGIDAQHTDRVFQMFQRLHGRGEYEGNGIGLPIVRKIVERHGGRIWFDSTPGQGTTFYFTLPAATAEAAAT